MTALPDEAIQSRRARILFALAIAGIVIYAILDAVAQSLPPHYSAVSQAESDLAVGPFGYVMTMNFINRGVLSLCFLFGLVLTVYSADTANARLRRGAYAFAVWSVGALLLAAFPTDLPATPVSWHGVVHLFVAIAAFLGGALGALYISLGMVSSSVAGARRAALPLAYLVVALCAVELLGAGVAPGFYSSYGGVVERMFLGSVLLWVGAVSTRMLTAPSLGAVRKARRREALAARRVVGEDPQVTVPSTPHREPLRRRSPDAAGSFTSVAVIFLLGLVGGVAVNFYFPLLIWPGALIRVTGSVPLLLGVVLFAWARSTFRRHQTALMPWTRTSALVTDGPYGFSRNPIYLSFVLMYLGLSLIFDSAYVLSMLLVVVLLFDRLQIPREERYLRRLFGSKFDSYAARVRRWI